jgi:hypothetical protein
MVVRWTTTILFCVVAAAAGCDRAKNPTDVHKNVSEAAEKANEKIADARKDAAVAAAEGRREVSDKVDDASQKVADANRDVAMARVEGERNVAKQRCESLSGDEQKSCKDAADREYELAKQRVDATFRN